VDRASPGDGMSPVAPTPREDLHPNARSVADALARAGVHGRVVTLQTSARTAVEAAAALSSPVGAICSSLVFVADGAPVLVLTSGAHRVDTAKVARLLGASVVARADADLVRQATGQPIGGVAPVGHPGPLPTLVDLWLAKHHPVWAAAGHPHTIFPTSFDELIRLTGGQAADIGTEPTPTPQRAAKPVDSERASVPPGT
jgi:prolyl-tRNA editing enzyme YbaK/EbsC (Cys-tRNA(Pro) deacylase)